VSAPKSKLVRVQRQLVADRAKGRCERCGGALAAVWECHHRKLRAHGGDWSLANLLALHPDCHNLHRKSVHQQPARSYELGYLVRSRHEPADCPVLLHGRRWVLLGPCGAYLDTEAPS
jgi:hypothetical protein